METAPEVPVEKRVENQFLGNKITLHGFKEIRWIDGKEVTVEPTDEPLLDFPKKFREHHMVALSKIFSTIAEFERQGRGLPLFRDEAIDQLEIEKQVLKDLERFGYLQSMVIACKTQDGKDRGGRLILMLTGQSRALRKTMNEAVQKVLEE